MNQVQPEGKQKKVLIIIAPEKFRDEELGEPIAYFDRAGVNYDLISTVKGIARGMLGDEVLIEKTIAEIQKTGTDQYDAVVLVGGSGSVQHLWDDVKLQTIISDFSVSNKIIGAICLSPVVLARAGILKGKKATVFPDDTAIAELKKGGGHYTPQPVVSDGSIVTANGPQAAGAFAEKLVRLLNQ
ncbi:MAG: DJ-1/PfpI family protein [Methanospirillaceae archaeon]|nr:DJ-1/PfpI family protein [Methanospirillaceae archaeon]